MIGSLHLSDLQSCMAAQIIGADVEFSRVSTDTRNIEAGDLFVALRGDNFDGNQFAQQAQAKGAVAVVVSVAQDVAVPQLLVENTQQALAGLAHLNRHRSAATVVAITGSQGKTSVKEMTGLILGRSFSVLVTRGNLNNTIGVPLTLLSLEAGHQRAVIELGANANGEIALTAGVTAPHIVLINNAAETHLEGFGDIEGVVRAKGEIIDSSDMTHTVVLNADDPQVGRWQARAGQRSCRLFSIHDDRAADYYASDIVTDASGTRFMLTTPQGGTECQVALIGMHNVANAVAASALAMEAGASLADVRAGLKVMKPVPGRLSPMAGVNGCRLLDDSYNASPSSFRAAIDVLAGLENHSRTVLVMGDMGELGDRNVVTAHREVGSYAKEKGINALWTTGTSSQLATEVFGNGAQHFENKQSLIEYALQHLSGDTVVLIKGSRGAAMDEVSNQLRKGENN